MLKKYLSAIILLTLIATGALLIYIKTHPKQLPSNLIAGVGTILGDEINLNTKYPGRIEEIYVEESQPIHKNELLAKLSSKELQAKLQSIQQSILAKQKEIEAKKVELRIAKESLPQNVQKALAKVKAQEAAIKELDEKIQTLQKVLNQDRKDFKRIKNLVAKRLLPHHELEKIQLRLNDDSNNLQALYAKKRALLASLQAAKSTLKQAKTALKNIEALQLGIEALQNALLALKAQKQEVEAMIDEMQLRSPIDGYVTQKIALKGEVIGSGMSVLRLLDPYTLYLQIFIDTLHNAKVKVGDRAVIFLDGMPDHPIAAKVVRIAKRAEFTPKEVAVRSDRIQKVYAVRIKPLKIEPTLKLGLPAIGVISTDGKGLPKSLKELPKL